MPAMTKLGIVFAAAISLTAFTGCKKKGGDCASSVNGLIDRMMGDEMKAAGDKVTPEMKKMAEEMKTTMSSAMVKVCTDDKWSADMLKCMDDAKDESTAKKCDEKLTPDQKKHLDEAMASAMGMGTGKHKADGDTPPAPPAEAPAPAPAGSDK